MLLLAKARTASSGPKRLRRRAGPRARRRAASAALLRRPGWKIPDQWRFQSLGKSGISMVTEGYIPKRLQGDALVC